jgi:multicomponent Na+:H+ antiporter subunit D
MIDQNLPVLIPVSYLFGALLIPLIGIWRPRLAQPVAAGVGIWSFWLALHGLVVVVRHGSITHYLGGWPPPLGIQYLLDPLSAFFILVIVTVSTLVLFHGRLVVEKELEDKSVPYYSVAMLLLAGFTGIVVTHDLFNLYVFLEIAALSGYALVAVGDKAAPVAAFRYLLIGTIGASFYLLGLALIYIMTGSLNMTDVAAILPSVHREPPIIVGLALMVAGMGIKMALFPMHGWLPDAYTYASSTSSALIAPIGTKVGAYVLIRILFGVFSPSFSSEVLPVDAIILWLAAAGIVFGSIMAIAQKELKRMLAYSSVAQVGYIGLGIGLANPLGLIGAVLHAMNHAVMKGCLFLVAGNLRTKIGHSSIPLLDESLRKKMPWSAAAFSVAALSMIGIPPTAGFFSKWYLVLAGIEKSNWIAVGIVLLSTLLNAVYFFRVLEKMYLRNAPDANAETTVTSQEVRPGMLVPTIVLAAALLVLGILNAVIVEAVIRKVVPEGL